MSVNTETGSNRCSPNEAEEQGDHRAYRRTQAPPRGEQRHCVYTNIGRKTFQSSSRTFKQKLISELCREEKRTVVELHCDTAGSAINLAKKEKGIEFRSINNELSINISLIINDE